MRVVPDWQEMNSVLRVIVTSSFVGFLLALIFVACNDEYYFGKTREELTREMLSVDSLIQQIQLELGDSTSMDFEKIYINARRINIGYQ